MAFPLEPSQLRAYQRAFCLATCENEYDSTKRVIKPLTLGLFYEACNAKYFGGYRPSSPPILVEFPETSSNKNHPETLLDHKRQSSHLSSKHLQGRRKVKVPAVSKSRKPLAENALQTELFGFENSVSMILPDAAKEKTKSTTKLNPLTKLFIKSDKQKVHENDSESTILGSLSQKAPANFYTSTSGSTPAIDEFTNFSAAHSLVSKDLSIEDVGASDDLETLDHISPDNTASEEESLNSAFTDIESESIIGSSSMMYDYTVPKTSVLHSDAGTKQNAGQKNASSIYSRHMGTLEEYPAEDKQNFDAGLREMNKRTPLLRKRESFTFPKVSALDLRKQTENNSNLTTIIHTRHNFSNANPLTFFSYSGVSSAEGARTAEIDIFAPPIRSPILEKLSISGSMPVFDCIGYILLKLSEMKNKALLNELLLSFNPNHYRLELTDEDGELYDSNFGVLDRTRQMSSYNCPKHLALCKVKVPGEISKNEKQSPLPPEFQQNLDVFEERARSPKAEETKNLGRTEDFALVTPGGHSIEVKVKHIPSTSKVISFFVASEMQVGALLDLICRQYQVDSTQYKLSGFRTSQHQIAGDTSLLSDKLDQDGHTIQLLNTNVLSEVQVDYFKMEHIMKQSIRSMLDVKANISSFQETGITPHSSAFNQAGITPPIVQLESKVHKEVEDNSETQKRAEVDDSKKLIVPATKDTKGNGVSGQNSTIANLISGRTSQLPSSSNTFYCKWRVFRKKAPLLYKIEKSLIIDGDYIHLAPTDDTNWKSNFNDHSFLGTSQSGNHHHHHYLHHYNYSKYYNDTMLKTSSFHISQIVKLKLFKESKSPTHFKIVIRKQGESGGKETTIKKKYDLEAETLAQCDEIFEKIKWALHLYHSSNAI